MRRAVYIEHWKGPDTINWLGAQLDVPHHSSLCINPPPFGAQCTMHAQHSLRACLLLRSCRSLACPDPQPYQPVDRRGRRRDNIAGPICQARSTSSVEEWRSGSRLASHHGMCAPNGCHNFFLTPVRLTQPKIRAMWRDVLSSDTSSSQIVLLSEEVPKAIWHDWLGLSEPIGLVNASDIVSFEDHKSSARSRPRRRPVFVRAFAFQLQNTPHVEWIFR